MLKYNFVVALIGAAVYAQERPWMTERPEDQDQALYAWLGTEMNGILKC